MAEEILGSMMAAEPNLRILRRHQLLTVEKDGVTVTGSTYRDRDTGATVGVSHAVAIDGTYEGDLAAAAGVPYRIGREGRKEFGEKFAGVIFHDWRYHRREILPESTGEPSEFVQANCFRMTLCDDAATRVRIERPASYADWLPLYRDLLVDFDSGRVRNIRDILWLNPLANRKYCVNGHIEALTSLNLTGLGKAWIESDWDGREELFTRYREFSAGLFYFLQNDPAIPFVPREDVRCFGLAPDEYTAEGHFPWQLYVRQGRRIHGEYVVTEHDSVPHPGRERPAIPKDAIGIYEHNFDSHACRDRNEPGAIVRTSDGFELIEGVIFHRSRITRDAPNRPASIPYRALLPERVDGIIVPTALSASNVAFTAIRMEPAWMSTGQAAGVAAALAVTGKISPRRIDARRLQSILAKQGQVLAYFRDLSPDDPDFADVQLAAVEMDHSRYDCASLKAAL